MLDCSNDVAGSVPKLAISVRDLKALLALGEDGLPFDSSLARVLGAATGEEVLFRLSATYEYAGIGRLAKLVQGGGRVVARFKGVRLFDQQALYWPQDADAPSISILGDAEFEAVLRSETSTLRREADEVGSRFVVEEEENLSLDTFAAIAQTVLREANYRCAVTGAKLEVEAPDGPNVFVLRPKEAGGTAHVNNCLALSPGAFAAFEQGHLAARDDFGLLADLRRIDPELLEVINPSGRLTVPDNLALQPAAGNLGYHRRTRFGLD